MANKKFLVTGGAGSENLFLREEGDYILFEPNEPHEFEFLEDTLIVTLRWRSI